MAIYKVEFMQHSKHVNSITYFSHLILYSKIMFVVGTTRKKNIVWEQNANFFYIENNGTCSYGHCKGLHD